MGSYLRQQAAHLLKNMKVHGAYMLAVVGGNKKPSVADCKKILSSVAIELDADSEKRLEELVEELSARDLDEILAAGQEKLKTVPGGSGGGGVAAAPGAAPGGAPAAGGDAGGKKEESEEEEMAPAAGLFDDGDDY